MVKSKAKIGIEKTNLHPRNLHRFGYDFTALITISPELKNFVASNEYQIGLSPPSLRDDGAKQTIDFSNPNAVKALNKALNKALLMANYNIQNWDIPENYLCPPIPGRVDYIHYIADLLATTNNGITPLGEAIQVLDIGVGANCIYPILGNSGLWLVICRHGD